MSTNHATRISRLDPCRKKPKRLSFVFLSSSAFISKRISLYLSQSSFKRSRLGFHSQSTPAMFTSVSSTPPAGFPPLRVRSLRSSKALRSLSILIFVIWTLEGWMPTCTVFPVQTQSRATKSGLLNLSRARKSNYFPVDEAISSTHKG